MKHSKTLILLFLFIIRFPHARGNDPDSVLFIMNKVADWQIAHFSEVKHNPLSWTNGPFYLGLVRLNELKYTDRYKNFLLEIGNSNHWALNDRKNNVYHADDFCVAQMYLEMYRTFGTKEILTPTLSKTGYTLVNPSVEPLWLGAEKGQERWSWCDALFMSPPVYAGLFSITGNEEYLRFLDREFRVCVDSLYDTDSQLFYRDRNYKGLREKNGQKVFWGRGNGWAIGGIASILRYLPESHRAYWYYADIFRQMAESILKCQDKNGYWHPSLLDPESYPDQENSSTALITYALAWGINKGLLDESVYKKPVIKAWESMVKCVSAEGRLGYVQMVGQKPEKISPESTEIFGSGAFLMAGAEMVRLFENQASKDVSEASMKKNALLVNEAFSRSHNYLNAWLDNVDPETGLIPRYVRNDKYLFWNAQDCGADNYAFMVLTSKITDEVLFRGRMLDMLKTEARLTSRLGACPATYSFVKKGYIEDPVDSSNVIFGSAEYMKDGLLPLTEWLGESPWSARLLSILDDLHKLTTVTTKIKGEYGGGVPEIEVNGDMLQTLSRMYWFTGKKEYLDWAIEIADYYLLTARHPSKSVKLRLRDHGCEIIQGLCELYATLHYVDPAKKEQYKKPLYSLLDRILQKGRNEDGFFYNEFNPRKGTVIDNQIADTWGYSMNAFYIVYMLDKKTEYRDAVMHLLDNLHKYRNYPWEGPNADGYADAIESAINLNNRLNREDVNAWIDSEIKVMWNMQKPDGIIQGNNADGNFARTSIMYALSKTQGTTINPWGPNVYYGALKKGDGISVMLWSESDWNGLLLVDRERHKEYMHLPFDWPRINQFQEWFTVKNGQSYNVVVNGNSTVMKGEDILKGINLKLKKDNVVKIEIMPL